jgi:hypothetical protein
MLFCLFVFFIFVPLYLLVVYLFGFLFASGCIKRSGFFSLWDEVFTVLLKVWALQNIMEFISNVIFVADESFHMVFLLIVGHLPGLIGNLCLVIIPLFQIMAFFASKISRCGSGI